MKVDCKDYYNLKLKKKNRINISLVNVKKNVLFCCEYCTRIGRSVGGVGAFTFIAVNSKASRASLVSRDAARVHTWPPVRAASACVGVFSRAAAACFSSSLISSRQSPRLQLQLRLHPHLLSLLLGVYRLNSFTSVSPGFYVHNATCFPYNANISF